ncbi:MAG: hypothetical protein KGL39_24510 [Patescibacteria group bacterium]|nr:hypothetical protein [Patescibacteria group bacterium]
MKLIFLEEMSGEEEDLLTFMINGGRGREIELSPGIRERRDHCRAKGYGHFSQVIFTGGRRSSKGHLTGIAGARKAFDILQLADPGAYFKMDPDKEIYLGCIAASLKQSKERQFADLYSAVTRCRPLAQAIPPGKALEESISIRTEADERNLRRMAEMGLKVSRDWSKIRIQPLAANADTVRGLAMIFTAIDEMAFMMPGESRASVSEVYAALEPSLIQFGHHALIMCCSSPYSKIGTFYDLFQLAMRPADHHETWYPMRFAVRFPSWALYDKWWLDYRWSGSVWVPKSLTTATPKVVSPDWLDQLDPHQVAVLDDFAKDQRMQEQLREKANPEKYRVENRAHWAEVLDAYLDPHRVDTAFSGTLPDGRPCRMSTGGGYLHDYKMWLDPSSTTAGFGFAIAHIEEFIDTNAESPFPGGIARHIVFDKVWRWSPDDFPEHTINYLKVKEEVQRELLVYRPSELFLDQFNSIQFSQELLTYSRAKNLSTKIGIDAATAKNNWERWECFKTALYLGLVHVPTDCIYPKGTTIQNYSEYASLELKYLTSKPAGAIQRVEKQEDGPIQTKDIADCIAFLTFKFLASYLESWFGNTLATLQTGSQGGYQIGGRNPGGPMQREDRGLSGLERFYSGRTSSTPHRTRSGFRPNRKR